ncbi:hypothetical protein PF004_g15752, partial [Phytophthora fragariae]
MWHPFKARGRAPPPPPPPFQAPYPMGKNSGSTNYT